MFGSKTQPCEHLQVLVRKTGTATAKDDKKQKFLTFGKENNLVIITAVIGCPMFDLGKTYTFDSLFLLRQIL